MDTDIPASTAEREAAEIPSAADIEISAPAQPLPGLSLENAPESLQEACARAGWKQFMPVQTLALPYLLDRRDIMVQSRTGSGKTGTYLLPLLLQIHADQRCPQTLVLVPTRELALQVEQEANTLFATTGIRSLAVYGGVGYKKQLQTVREGVQLVIGTPGRILDLLLRHALDFSTLHTLVFDEADRMLSIGFYPEMKEIQRFLPTRDLHTCLFSATYPPHVLQLAREFMRQPDMLSLSQKEVHVAAVSHTFCRVKPMDKDRALIRLLEVENPSSAIIFCNTKANVHYVTDVLKGFGYNADELSADLSQHRREAVLRKIRNGRLQYLVATDVAARGIDIPELSHVFLYEPPEDQESYIHRAGRTGRAGAAGTVISLVDVMQALELDRIAKSYRIPLQERAVPEDADVARAVAERTSTILEAQQRTLTGLEKLRIARYLPLAYALAGQQYVSSSEDSSQDEDSFFLLAMLLDNCHQQALQATRGIQDSDSRERRSKPRKKHRPSGGAQKEQEHSSQAASGQQSGEASSAELQPQRRSRARRRKKNNASKEDWLTEN